MSNTKIKAGQFSGIVGNGADGYFLMTNGDGTMAWAEGGATGPSVTSVSYPGDDLAADPAGGQTVVLTGTGFATSGMTVSIGGTTAPSVAHDSNTQLTITTPAKAAGDYDIVVTNTVTGASGTFVNGISYNGIPTWTTAAGSLGTFESETTISTITLQATEPDGGTITFNITNGALPTGLSLTGANIDGTTTAESSTTLYSFTIEAIDNENQATPRNFSITVNSAEITPSENFTINTYTGNGSTQSIEGKIGTAAEFNGSSSKITNSSLAVNTSNSFSISLWVYPQADNTYQRLLQFGNHGTEFLIQKRGDNNKARLLARITNTIQVDLDGAVLTNNQWHHIAVTVDGTTASLYVNNLSPLTDNSFNAQNYTGLYIGHGQDNREFTNGKIDQVRIFNTALSSSEVTTLSNETNASSTKSTTDIFDDGSGVALYEFEEGAKDTGLPLADYTPIANRTFESSKSTSAESTAPRDIKFSSDGTKLFFCDGSNNRIHQYTMTTAWNVSTASHNGYYDVTGQISGGAFPISVQFKSDGTKMYVSTYAASPERIYEYNLSSAWVVTSGVSYNSRYGNVTVQAWGMEFNSAGTILICSSDSASGNLCKYTLSTAWDISTISLSQQITLASIKGIDLSPDGKQLLGAYFPSSGNKTIKSYSLSTAYDITTLTQREEWDVNSIENVLQTVTCKFDGSNKIDKLYFVGFQQDTIYGYDIDETADFIAGYDGTPTNVNFLGMAFTPDFVWIKPRSIADNHNLFDSIRGATKQLISNNTSAESTQANTLTSFDSNGFSIGPDNNINTNNATHVAWCWKAGGAAVSNTDGNIDGAVSVSANPDAGFSIVRYSGTRSTHTVGHGLAAAPEMIIIKEIDEVRPWGVYHKDLTSAEYVLRFNDTRAEAADSTQFASTDPTSEVFTVGSSTIVQNGTSNQYIAYCFHSVDGYQKVGSYAGNGGNQSITTGFAPRFVMVKSSSATGSWYIFDSSRGDFVRLFPDSANSESTSTNQISLGSDGFSSGGGSTNASGFSYIYLAIA